MNRRQMISTLGVAAAGGAALAMPARAEKVATGMGTDNAKAWMTDTVKIGSLSLLASRQAVDKAHGKMTKQFAGWEVAEQETVGDIMKSMMPKAPQPRGALNPPTDAEAMKVLDDDAKAKLTDLKGKSGADFDKAFVSLELDGHKKLLTVQEDYLKLGTDPLTLDVAKLVRGMVKEHIDHLDAIMAQMG